MIFPAQRNDSTTNTRKVFDQAVFPGFNFEMFYRPYLNDIDEMCELWIAKCPLVCALFFFIATTQLD